MAAAMEDDDFTAGSKPTRASGKAKAKANAAPEIVTKACLCCEATCQKGSKFCQLHKRSADAMTYQAKTQSAEAVAVVKAILGDDVRAREEVCLTIL